MTNLIKAASVLFILTHTSHTLATEFSDPEIVVNNCYACHGQQATTGSTGTVPRLNNLPARYLIDALRGFKYDKREGTIMNRIAKGYSDGELSAIASYLASKNTK